MRRKERRNTYTAKNGKFAKNNPGRPKGSKDKFTSLKDAFLSAFEDLGGEEGLKNWAEKSEANRREFYRMITKMLPANVSVDGGLEIQNIIVSDKFLPKDNDGAKSE